MLENRGAADSHVTAYRPDVDGLRAIAVIGVIAFHLSKAALPGGYFGVDMFFVLSGYLITAIIWREIGLGEFSIVRFYDRRIRRIAPALLLVLAATTVGATLLLLPMDLIGYAKSVLATVAFVANVYFWRDTDYFSRLADEKPLLHMWSLGVEEQFYVLFPLLLFLIARYHRKWVATWITATVLASLLFSAFLVRVGGALPAFYLLPARAWELGVGALIVFIPSVRVRWTTSAGLLGLLGATLVAFGLVWGPNVGLPWLPEAVPVTTGTALLIWSGSAAGPWASRCLSWRPLVFVGLISYSLYLWHWPVIVLLKYYLVRDLGVRDMGAAIALMTVCAVLSWRYVERPFRSTSMPIVKVRYAALGGSMVATAIGVLIIAAQGLPARLNPAAARINAAVGTNYRCAVSDYIYLSQSRACVLDLPSRDPKDADVVLLGNSHAQMYAPVWLDILRGLSLHGLLVPANGCLPTYQVNINPACLELADRNIDAVAHLQRARVVIIGTTWGDRIPDGDRNAHYTADGPLVGGLDRTVDRLLAAGKRVVLIGPIPIPNWDVASVASRDLAFGRSVGRPLFGSQQQFLEQYSASIAHFEARHDIEFVRPDRDLCAAGRCNYIVDGRAVYADDNHLAAAELLRFRPAFNGALRRALGRN
jgi:peptidoglycan/LPS O-acetylase OafA/YrhL